MRWTVICAAIAAVAMAGPAGAAETYYIGDFKGSVPRDDRHCGTGKLAHPEPHPCATLSYWTDLRREVLREGDRVHLAQGSYSDLRPTGYHCLAAQRGVTYEGRTPEDESLADATRKVVIDLVGATKDAVCFGRGVTCPSTRGCDASGFTVRDIEFRGGPNQGVKIDVPKNVTTEGLLFERVRVVNFGAQGFNISNQPSDIDCSTTGRRVRDLVIRDSIIESNHGVFGGIAINCVDGFLLEGNVVRSNLPTGCTWNECSSGKCSCNDHDGVQLGGAINGVVRGNTIHNCGEDCLDLGGHWRKTYNVTVEDNWIYNGASRWVKISGQAHDIALRNNFFTGRGLFEIGTCERNIDVYNNTLWRADDGLVLKLWTKCHSCEFVNNIIRGSAGSASERIVMVSRANTDADTVWTNNLIYNEGDVGWAIREELGRGNCGNCTCGGQCEAPQWCPDPWPAAQRDSRLTQGDLERFQARGDAGDWFGPESGDSDVWGVSPEVVDADAPTAANLHLAPTDTAARARGRDLSGAARCMVGFCVKGSPGMKCRTNSDCGIRVDYDGDRRIGSWDIGADELNKADMAIDEETPAEPGEAGATSAAD